MDMQENMTYGYSNKEEIVLAIKGEPTKRWWKFKEVDKCISNKGISN